MAFRSGREDDLTARFGSQQISSIQLDFDGIVLFIGPERSEFIKFANLYQQREGDIFSLFLGDRASLMVSDILMQVIVGFRMVSNELTVSLANGVELGCRVDDDIEAVISFDGYF